MIEIVENCFLSKSLSSQIIKTEKSFLVFLGNPNNEMLLGLLADKENIEQAIIEAAQSSKLNVAIIYIDLESKYIYLLRDRFGIQPLFYLIEANNIYVSDKAKDIALFMNKPVNIDYCSRGAKYKIFDIAGSESPFKDVEAVTRGGYLKISLVSGVKETQVWYNLELRIESKKEEVKMYSEVQIKEKVLRLLSSSIDLNINGFTQLAATLSGGLDSSAVAALTKSEAISYFSFSSPAEILSEGPSVEQVSKYLEVHVNYVWPNFEQNDLKKLLKNTVNAQGAPFIGLSVLAQNYLFSKAAEQGKEVILGGQGSDEIFAGYRKFFLVALKEALSSKNYVDVFQCAFSLFLVLASEYSNFKLYLRNLSRYKKIEQPELKALNFTVKSEKLLEGGLSLTQRQIQDLTHWSIPTLLRIEGNNGDYYGLNCRYPFMDYELVEFALALPARYKIRNGYGKWILRQSLQGLLPNKILFERKKRGFDITQNWLQQGLCEEVLNYIKLNSELAYKYLKPDLNLEILAGKDLIENKDLFDEFLILYWIIDYESERLTHYCSSK